MEFKRLAEMRLVFRLPFHEHFVRRRSHWGRSNGRDSQAFAFPFARLGIGRTKMLAHSVGKVVVKGARMRLLVVHSNGRQEIDDGLAFYFELTRQLIDSNRTHLSPYCTAAIYFVYSARLRPSPLRLSLRGYPVCTSVTARLGARLGCGTAAAQSIESAFHPLRPGDLLLPSFFRFWIDRLARLGFRF